MALKEFEAGDSIKAVDTNANNRYLESLIGEAAGDLRTYLENQIAILQGNFVLPGMVLAIPYSTVPVGYLKCDGSSLLREDYEDLFDAIGTLYGAVDDYHFNLPDYQGVFLRGYGGNSASLGTKQTGAVPNITGNLNGHIWNNNQSDGAFSTTKSIYAFKQGGTSNNAPGVYSTTWNLDASRSSSVYKDVSEVRPDNMSVIWVIKY